ncbi:MAG TPA: SirB1 family protein [Halomicronema sp.]
MEFPTARQFFYKEIYKPEPQIDLAKAALYLAQEEYPNLDTNDYINVLDTMAAEIEKRLPEERYPLRVIKTINEYLYGELGFIGNTNDYYNPRNSFLNDVLDRRTGIPISLALVYLEIARRLDFPMVGVGMPGHFLIRPDFEDSGILVDAFDGGEILFPEDCQARLTAIYGKQVELSSSFLEPVTPRRFLGRMLSNLKLIYINRGDILKSLSVVERILLLFPGAPIELRDRGILYYQLGYFTKANQDLQSYLVQVPNAEDADVIRKLVERLSQDL